MEPTCSCCISSKSQCLLGVRGKMEPPSLVNALGTNPIANHHRSRRQWRDGNFLCYLQLCHCLNSEQIRFKKNSEQISKVFWCLLYLSVWLDCFDLCFTSHASCALSIYLSIIIIILRKLLLLLLLLLLFIMYYAIQLSLSLGSLNSNWSPSQAPRHCLSYFGSIWVYMRLSCACVNYEM